MSVSFEKDESVGVRNHEVGSIRVYSNGNNVIIENVKIGQTIRVYDLDGMTITQMEANHAKNYIPLSSNKVYIIAVGNQTFKIAL